MKVAGVKQFKAQLSMYLREVKTGETILVTDRGQVVAEVRPPGAASMTSSPEEARYQEAVGSGLIRPARVRGEEAQRLLARLAQEIRAKGPMVPKGTKQAILDELREDSAS